ncbi:MAG: HlyD family secretion protein [Porticoccaceae bacterium]
MKSWVLTILIAGLIAAGSYFFYINTLPPKLETGLLYGNGHVEGTEVSISAEVTGRVLASNLVEGQPVARGSLLVELDASDQNAQLATAEAEIKALTFQQGRIREQLATANDLLETAGRELVRHQALRKTGVVTEQKLDQIASTQRETLGQVRALRAQLEENSARIEQARHQAEYLRIQAAKARIYAPLDATVLSKGIEVGELAEPGRNIAVLVDMNDLELKVYLPEAVIGNIKLNDPARVRVSAFPDRYFEARVKRVEQRAQFTPRDINMPEERVRMVFGVVLALANPDGHLKPGMPVDTWIRWDAGREWPEHLVVPR